MITFAPANNTVGNSKGLDPLSNSATDNKMAEKISLRIYILLLAIVAKLQLWAQPDDDDDIGGVMPGRGTSLDDMEDYLDYQPFHISFSDVLMIVLLLVACYVFGKIWKGCSYLLLVVAAIFYYMTH